MSFLIRLDKLFSKLHFSLAIFFKISKYPFSFPMYILCTTGSLHCGILRVFSYLYTYLPLRYRHMQLCNVSVSNPLVTPTHNGTTCVNMVILLLNGCMCVLKDFVDVKHILDKNLTILIR